MSKAIVFVPVHIRPAITPYYNWVAKRRLSQEVIPSERK